MPFLWKVVNDEGRQWRESISKMKRDKSELVLANFALLVLKLKGYLNFLSFVAAKELMCPSQFSELEQKGMQLKGLQSSTSVANQ